MLKKKHIENIVGKGEYAGKQHFYLYPQCFLPYQRQIIIWSTYKLLSSDAFSLDKCKMLSFDQTLIQVLLLIAYA